jgi:transposase InsO family protein
MPNTPSDPDWELALAKYAVIAPLVCRNLEPAEREELRKQILAATHRFPGDRFRRVAPRTLREWIQRHRVGGLDGLRSGPRKDKGTPRAVPLAVIERAKALKAELPARSSQTIANLLVAEGQGAVSPSTIGYHLRQAPVLVQPPGDGGPKAFRRFEHPHPNDCWQSDMSDGLWLPDPADPGRNRKCYLHGFIDDHSRLVTHAQFYWRESLPALENCFRRAITKHGIPRMVYWDNGSAYRATQLRKMAARLGTEIVFATPYAPEGKGKIERFWGTAKALFYPEAAAAGIQTLDELNQFWWAWLERHYTTRPHSETGQAPIDRWEAGREHVRDIGPDELADTFLWEEDRRVTKTGDIQLGGNRYPVPAQYVGQRVVVRYDPFDLAEVKVVLRGQLLGSFRPAQLIARTFSKAQPVEERPGTLASSSAFKERLVAKAEGQDARWAQLAAGTPTTQTDAEFALQLSALLAGRPFDEAERQALAHFRRRYGPPPELTDRAVADATSFKGTERPLAYYLDAIEAALQARGSRP